MTQKCPRQFSKSRLEFVDVMGQIEWSSRAWLQQEYQGGEEEKKFENNIDFVRWQSSNESLSNFWITHIANISFSFLTICYAFIARFGYVSILRTFTFPCCPFVTLYLAYFWFHLLCDCCVIKSGRFSFSCCPVVMLVSCTVLVSSFVPL